MNAQLRPQITVTRERYSEALCAELLPLLKDNWVRSESAIGDLPLEPDFEAYRRLDAKDLLVCLTARRDGALVGYAVYFVNYSLHHKSVKVGHGDMIYVKGDEGLGQVVFKLLAAAEADLRARGVRYMGWFARRDTRVYNLLRGCHYLDDEIVMEKEL